MNSLILSAVLCNTTLVGFNSISENERIWINTAKEECAKRDKEKPCLTQYIKKDSDSYRAICGKNNATKNP
jgi:hypothetical protein